MNEVSRRKVAFCAIVASGEQAQASPLKLWIQA
jgi:hypothetical protein